MIPMMLSLPVGAMLSGALITMQPQLGYRIWVILGAAGIVVSNAVYTTFTSNTSNANLVGVLILGGLSLGPIVQVPLLCAQNAVTLKDMAVTSSTMNFWQS